MEELWVSVEEFPDYSVSSFGRVRHEEKQRPLKISFTPAGLSKVNFSVEGKVYTRSVSVLVANTFLERPAKHFDTPLHLDGDQTNNRADNLVWRPRWFTWQYRKELNMRDYYHDFNRIYGNIADVKTGLVYKDIFEASERNGVLCSEIVKSLVSQLPVFPTWQVFGRIE